MPPEIKLCKDCRWAEDKMLHFRSVGGNPCEWICHHESSLRPTQPDYVTGQPVKPMRQRCLDARDDPRLCGPEGKYWEAKPENTGGVVGFEEEQT